MYRSLNAQKIVETATQLRSRVEERFPESSLRRMSHEVVETAEAAVSRTAWIGRPIWWLRVGIWILAACLLVVLVAGLVKLHPDARVSDLTSFVQTVESGINDIILLGAGIYFLLTIEARIKRRAALKAIHELRSLAHIVDMHQLTKDPERVCPGEAPTMRDTASSPKRTMTPFELFRYLDYCSEMLAVIGKIAALHAQRIEDPVVLAAVDEVEDLTTGISRKIWQKITILTRD